jgi:hypothetical protein
VGPHPHLKYISCRMLEDELTFAINAIDQTIYSKSTYLLEIEEVSLIQ